MDGITASDLKVLYRLQNIDIALDELSEHEATLPEKERREVLTVEKRELSEAVAGQLERLRAEELRQKKVEGEVDLLGQKIDKEQKKLYSGTIANPKELASIQQELKSLRSRQDEEETALLEQIEVVESLTRERSERAGDLDAKTVELADTERVLAEKLAEIESERKALQAQRDEAAAQIPEPVMELYLGLRKKHRNAVVLLKNGLCQGCRVELPAEDVDRITSAEGLWRCPNCGRILITKP